MKQTQSNLPFEIVTTKDGSPSLAFFKDGHSQMMHSSEGAYAETEYVYGKALDLAHKHFQSLRVLSVGLGFGYVELSTAVRAHQHPTSLISYEKEPILREAWQNFIKGQPIDANLLSCYEKIFQMYSEAFTTPLEHLKSFFIHPNFEVRGELSIDSPPAETFNCILFDPFCSKFSPEFWQEAPLTSFLQHIADESCVFATYAATGVLNRALKQNGFMKLPQKGFGVKREFTLAIRGFSLP